MTETCAATTAEALLDADEAQRWANLFKALGDPTRVRIVEYIASDDCAQVCACHLPEALGISQPTLSHHMKKLVEAGILTRTQRGRWADYAVDTEVLGQLRQWPLMCRC
ncbi:MAG TPA: winged helix-turn-helix transcriptional regulator [Propionibacterium sp.]|jgi:ArsR family transcriptional regulator|nr:winged helix-turn-helix transcriptional regulator [Propionibacterium sp.]